jgi:hypothetical protein
MTYRFERVEKVYNGEQMRAEVDALQLGDYEATWTDAAVAFEFDTELTATQEAQLAATFAAHDGAAALALLIQADIEAGQKMTAARELVSVCRAKKLANKPLTVGEKEQLIEAFLFIV